MSNLDRESLLDAINKLDSDIGKNSRVHKDTLIATSMIILRGKELRNYTKHNIVGDRYSNVIDYLKKTAPNLDERMLRFSLFREGIIYDKYLIFINFIIPIIQFIIMCIVSIFVDWSKDSLEEYLIQFAMFVVSAFFSLISWILIFEWRSSLLPSHFFIGHRRGK